MTQTGILPIAKNYNAQIQVINATPQKRCLAYKKSPEKKRGKRLPSLWGG